VCRRRRVRGSVGTRPAQCVGVCLATREQFQWSPPAWYRVGGLTSVSRCQLETGRTGLPGHRPSLKPGQPPKLAQVGILRLAMLGSRPQRWKGGKCLACGTTGCHLPGTPRPIWVPRCLSRQHGPARVRWCAIGVP
jgi:hypothetical protein